MQDASSAGAHLQPEVIRYIAELSRWKWHAPLLKLLFEKPMRLSELRRAIPNISTKVLVQNLRQLEAEGLVMRTDHSERRKHVEYRASSQDEALRLAVALVALPSGELKK
jgi:DNA-binding HxlR family transcriptional regulator